MRLGAESWELSRLEKWCCAILFTDSSTGSRPAGLVVQFCPACRWTGAACCILRLVTSSSRIATLQAWVLKYNEEVGERKEAHGAAAAALAQVLSHLQSDTDLAHGLSH